MLTRFTKSITMITKMIMINDYKSKWLWFQLGDKKDEEPKLTTLPKWLNSQNDFNKAIKLIEDIRANTNNVKSSSANKKVFNNLDKLINDIKNKKTTKEDNIKKIKNIFFWFRSLKAKKVLFFKIKWLTLPTIYLIHLESTR